MRVERGVTVIMLCLQPLFFQCLVDTNPCKTALLGVEDLQKITCLTTVLTDMVRLTLFRILSQGVTDDTVACTIFANVCTRNHFVKANRLTGKEICKVTWRFRKSVLIREKTAILANVVVLAIDVVLAIVGVPTRLSKMKMKPPILSPTLTLPSKLRTYLVVDRLLSESATWLDLGISHPFPVTNRSNRSGRFFEIILN